MSDLKFVFAAFGIAILGFVLSSLAIVTQHEPGGRAAGLAFFLLWPASIGWLVWRLWQRRKTDQVLAHVVAILIVLSGGFLSFVFLGTILSSMG
jgi:hypothetical protein